MALNVPYVATIALDYVCLASLALVSYFLAAAPISSSVDNALENSLNPALDPLMAMLCSLYLVLMNTSRDLVYRSLFRPHWAQVKTELRFLKERPDFLADIICTPAIVCIIPALFAFFGSMHCTYYQGNLARTMLEVSADYYLVNIIKDNISMRFVHPWMHQPKHYWIHKRHHAGNRNTVHLHAFVFDFLDLNLEFGIGTSLALIVKKLVFGGNPSLHFLSYLYSGWTDGNAHSMNPYTQAIGNPVLDWFLTCNIQHTLHHAWETDPRYMTAFPYHQIGSLKERDADIDKYNKIMKTNVDFRIFI